jgi:GTP-binding protein Era
MLEKAVSTITDADLVLVMADPLDTPEKLTEVVKFVEQAGKEAFLVVNKADLMNSRTASARLEELGKVYPFTHRCCISSTEGTGIDELIGEIRGHLPEGPQYYPDDMITDAPERFLCQEFIREKVFELTQMEIPYAAAVEIEEFREAEPVYIRAVIHVERDSQKRIVIGSKGRMLKEIGTQARREIERLLGSKVFLELFVRVTKDWSKDAKSLKGLGYR